MPGRHPDPLTEQRRIAEEARDAHLAWLLEALDVDCVLDVGANRGQFGTAVRALGFDGRLVSFEPASGPRAELEAAAAGDPDWLVRPWALGESDGEADLHTFAESELASFRAASAFGTEWKPLMGSAGTETVPVRRLDGVWDDVVGDAQRVLLKLDTQGFDLPALRGAGQYARPGASGLVALLSEVAVLSIYDGAPTMAESLTAYADLGWALAGLYPVSFDAPTLRVIEFDAVLVADPG